jgi:transposase-like protein
MRPTKLTPSVAVAVCDARKNGATVEEAAAAAGIPREYISRWRKLARIGKPLYEAFDRMWREAEEQANALAVNSILKACA